ncbi:hypothetical protein HDU97_010105 [Phlyctochytrium planicorne]|nr:hypothetical protein HDU97_010105 [Phlyctochytrium planicorne]
MPSVKVDVASVSELKDGEMKEVSLGEGNGKALLSKINGEFYATSHLCPHYKAPLIKGVLSQDGRFRLQTGDIEDGPSVDGLHSYTVEVKGGRVFVTANTDDVKTAKKVPVCVKKNKDNSKVVVVLGGGAAGLVAAEALRQEGFSGRIVLVSRESYLPIDRPKLSKALKVEASKIALRDAEHFKELDIEVRLSTFAISVDTEKKVVTLDNGALLSYNYLIAATGGDPRTLPVQGKELGNIFTLRGVDDSNGIEKAIADIGSEKPNVVVVGSSFIGMEAAAILAKTCKVTVIGMEKVPFERVLGPKVGEALGKLNAANGVTLKMEAMLDRFEPSAKNKSKVGFVVLKSGEKIPADVIIIGAGVIPKTDYFQSPVTFDRDRGITVNAKLQIPNADGVFAVGDIARYPYHLTGESVRVEHWNVAQNQGRVAAHNIAQLAAGKEADKDFVQVPYFWTVQYGKSIRYAGHAESFDEVVIQGSTDVDNLSFVAFYGRKGKVLAVASVAKDPAVSHASELIRVDKMPSIAELQAGKDILTVPLTGDDSKLAFSKKSSKSAGGGSDVTLYIVFGMLIAAAAFANENPKPETMTEEKKEAAEDQKAPQVPPGPGSPQAVTIADNSQAAVKSKSDSPPPPPRIQTISQDSKISAIIRALAIFASIYNLISIPMNIAWTCDMATIGNITLNYILDVFFLADGICECFRQKIDEFGFPVTDPAILAKAYLFGRLGLLSMFGAIPFDLIPLIMGLPSTCNDYRSFYSAQMALFFQNRDLRTDLERAYSIIETLLAAMIFGGLLGLIMALIKSTVKTVASKQAIEDGMIEENIKKFMVSKSFPPHLQDEVMKHIRYKANMMKGMELGKAFGELPDTLTEDIYLCEFFDKNNRKWN